MNDIPEMSLAEARDLWQKYIKKPLPKIKKNTLIKYIYWYQQAKENRVSLRAFFKLIEKAGREFEENRTDETCFEIGTKFIRSYKGEKYEVEVVKDGYLFRGEICKSLSAIARKITGAQWNGKVFFRGNDARR